jgi:hypothetical protein
MQTTTTLGEQIMLLSLDEETGAAKQQSAVHYAVAGGALVDLALAGRIALGGEDEKDRGRVLVRHATPLGEAAPDLVLERLAAKSAKGARPGKPKDWIFLLAGKCGEAARRSLVDRGIVREESKKILGLLPGGTRYPEADASIERELRADLTAVLREGAEPGERLAALIALLHGAKLHKLVLPNAVSSAEGKRIRERMTQIAEGDWAGAAVGKVIGEVQLALISVVLTTTVVSGS